MSVLPFLGGAGECPSPPSEWFRPSWQPGDPGHPAFPGQMNPWVPGGGTLGRAFSPWRSVPSRICPLLPRSGGAEGAPRQSHAPCPALPA
jgi:hypothetical protein